MILVIMIMIILETDYYYYPAVNMYSLFFTPLSRSLLITLASMSQNHMHSSIHTMYPPPPVIRQCTARAAQVSGPPLTIELLSRVRSVCVSVRVCTIYSTSFTLCLYICPYKEEGESKNKVFNNIFHCCIHFSSSHPVCRFSRNFAH